VADEVISLAPEGYTQTVPRSWPAFPTGEVAARANRYAMDPIRPIMNWHCPDGRRKRTPDGEAVAEGLERLVELALRHPHIADFIVGDRQITLPLAVAAIAGQPLANSEAVAVGVGSTVPENM
jgi:hypothetical protein